MKKNKFLNIKSLVILTFSLLIIASCSEDTDYGLDATKVQAKIFDFAGTSLVNLNDVAEFSVTPRAGSTFIWEANGATIQAIAGATHKVNVSFTQVGAATVSVYEQTAGGAISEATVQTVNVLQLCDWTLDMQDAYGDGWNGAAVEISFVGGATIDPVTIGLADGASGSQTFSAPHGYDMTVTYISGAWDVEVTYQIKDPSGTVVFSDGTSPTIGVAYSATVNCN